MSPVEFSPGLEGHFAMSIASETAMRTIRLPFGETVPVLGQDTQPLEMI
jgi:hypothetical protein